MGFLRQSGNPTVLQALLICSLVPLFWQAIFSCLDVGNVFFLSQAATTATIYWFAKSSSGPNFLGRSLGSSDAVHLAVLLPVAILIGVGCWALLIFFDACLNGAQIAAERWRLVSRQTFDEMEWWPPYIVGHLLMAAVLAPISEEIIFRGFILTRLRERHGTVLAVIVSAALFGALHVDKSFIGAFVLGVLYAVVAIRTSSLYASMLLHGLYNAAVSVLRFGVGVGVVADARMIASPSYWTLEFMCGLAGLALFTAYLFWPLARQRRTTVTPATGLGI